MEIITVTPLQTKKAGAILAKEIIRENSWPNSRKFAIALGLKGDLGGGKTTLLQGFARGLRIKEKILSPTFVIMRKFKIRVDSCSDLCRFVYFYHIDCYRVKKPKEILDLGFREIIFNPKNIVAIEWADRIKKIMPKDTLWIKFEFINQKARKITFVSP